MPDSDVQTTSRIMSQIYRENPKFWPNGLSLGHMDGGAWLVRKDGRAAGFVGWQERREGLKKIGYYSIGVLPEFRGSGVAKAALRGLLDKQAASVDSVRALINMDNLPSQKLAAGLGIPVKLVKNAGVLPALGRFAKWMAPPTASLGAGLGWGALVDSERQHAEGKNFSFGEYGRSLYNRPMNSAMALLNWGLFHRGGKDFFGKGNAPATKAFGLAQLIGVPTKDLAVQGIPTVQNINAAAARYAREGSGVVNNSATAGGNLWDSIPGAVKWGVGGAGGLGLAAFLYNQQRQAAAAEAQSQKGQSGTLRVTLPTKKPGDAETELEMPLSKIQLSDTLRGKLHRDLKRKLRTETAARTYRRPSPAEGAVPTIDY